MREHTLRLIDVDEAPSLIFEDVVEERRRHKEWLQALMAAHKVLPSDVVARSGVSNATVYRILSDEGDTVASNRSIAAIAKAFNHPQPGAVAPDGSPAAVAGFCEPEAERLSDRMWTELRLQAPSDGGLWRINGRALELAGWVPGDVVQVDFAATPMPGDVVCAQVYNLDNGTAETVFRIFEPPYLVTATLERRSINKPLYIDQERVLVRGVVVETLRIRSSV